jgi:membrane-anchored protein YejM (alkaline phosphatase superfamily)
MDAWLERNAGEKVFVWLNLLSAHKPYNPPPWTMRRTTALEEFGSTVASSDQYDGEVLLVDELVGRAVGAVDARVGRDRSAVILTSGNGVEFGEHGREGWGHGMFFENLRVPLIVRAPSAPAGRTVPTIVRTIDILPTALELAGVEAPEGIFGESLVPLFPGAGVHRMVFAEGVLFGTGQRTLSVGTDKLLYDDRSGRFVVFDVIFDPMETVDVRLAHPERADSLKSALLGMHSLLNAKYMESGRSPASEEEVDRFESVME